MAKIHKIKFYKNRLIDRSLEIDSDISKVLDRLDKNMNNDSIEDHQYLILNPIESNNGIYEKEQIINKMNLAKLNA